MKIPVLNYGEISGLVCPNCDNDFLHHEDVAVFNRSEDSDKTQYSLVSYPGITHKTVDSSSTNNPSRRRHGLRITFTCELCGDIQDLCLEQHKGNTFIYWDVNNES